MNKQDVLLFGKKLAFTAGKYSPKALTGISAGATAGGIFLAVKAGMEFQKLRDSGEDIGWKDYVRIFGPPAAAGVFSMVCAFASLSKMEQRYAAAALLANTYEMTQKEFDAKAREILGDGKVEKVHDEVNKDKIKKLDLGDQNVTLIGEGGVWFVDEFSNQKVYTTMEKIDAGVNQINDRINNNMNIGYGEYLDTLGFPDSMATWEYVWNLDSTGIIELRKTWDSLDGRTPVCILEHKTKPKLRYDILGDSYAHFPGWSEV